jgi:hypothetical protein
VWTVGHRALIRIFARVDLTFLHCLRRQRDYLMIEKALGYIVGGPIKRTNERDRRGHRRGRWRSRYRTTLRGVSLASPVRKRLDPACLIIAYTLYRCKDRLLSIERLLPPVVGCRPAEAEHEHNRHPERSTKTKIVARRKPRQGVHILCVRDRA